MDKNIKELILNTIENECNKCNDNTDKDIDILSAKMVYIGMSLGLRRIHDIADIADIAQYEKNYWDKYIENILIPIVNKEREL
jgi:hypothetical protein